MATRKSDDKKPHGLTGKPGNNPGGSPMLGDKGLNVEPGDTSKYIAVSMELMNLPKIDLHDVGAVEDRLNEFFRIHANNDMKPTVAGMGLALNGLDRRRLWEIRTGVPCRATELQDLPSTVVDTIKKAYHLMENLWENYMQNGKINPMSGVFLGVNNYGYQDVKQVNLTPIAPNNSENDYDIDSIRQRYMLDSPDDSDNDS